MRDGFGREMNVFPITDYPHHHEGEGLGEPCDRCGLHQNDIVHALGATIQNIRDYRHE